MDAIPNSVVMKRLDRSEGETLLVVGRAWVFDDINALPWIERAIDRACERLEPVEHDAWTLADSVRLFVASEWENAQWFRSACEFKIGERMAPVFVAFVGTECVAVAAPMVATSS